MPQIIIDKKLCTRCNTCATLCVMGIIDKTTDSGYPTIPEEKTDYCLKCGHCESFCAQRALTLDFLLNEKIDATSFDSQIEPQDLALYIKKRRSVRHFSSKTVNKELIAKVIDVARYAASGGNGQPVKWIVVHEPSEVKHIAGLTIDWMRTIRNTSHPLADFVPAIISTWDNGLDLICHNAPHLLLAHVPVVPIDDPTEAIIAMTHFDIAAPSFGIGTCWAGFVKMAMDNYKPLRDLLSLPEGRKAACPMLFGYSSYKITSIPRRNPADITWK
jgi:nitroreductase/Pyruvate/2-oxoacid:ferredoxin oxidoreductase delta subunit